MWVIKNKVCRLKQDANVGTDMPLKGGQEVEIVMDVVYINGHPVPPNLQKIFFDWVNNNPSLFDDVTKNWK